MKLYVLGLILIVCSLNLVAQGIKLDWVNFSEGINNNEQSRCMVTDSLGNLYNTGYFWGTVDFDPDTSTFILTSNGWQDIFLQKTDSNGNFIWVLQIGGSISDFGNALALDPTGNIYVSGEFSGTVDFDPDTSTFNLTSTDQDGYILKLDPNGAFIWAKSIIGSSFIYSNSMTTDSMGGVITSGRFRDTVDFDPSSATFNLISSGNGDGYLLKLDANGNFVWANSIGGVLYDNIEGHISDKMGNIYSTGYFSDTVDFDPDTSTYNIISKGKTDMFIQKLDVDGKLVWVKSIGDVENDGGYSISLDALGNIFIAGKFEDTVDFDPGTSNFIMSSGLGADLFILKINSNGNFIWAKSLRINDVSRIINISADAYGNTCIAARHRDTNPDVDPGSGVYHLGPYGDHPHLFLKLDVNGDFIWAKGFGSLFVTTLIAQSSGVILSTGYFNGKIDFDPGTDTLYKISNGVDLFRLKLEPCFSTNKVIDKITACDSLTWIDGITYYSDTSNVSFGLTNSSGCDSVVTLDLAVNYSTSGVDLITTCDSITWIDGKTYTSNNDTATHNLINATGCDSVVTLSLIVNKSYYRVDSITSCDSIIWIDGKTYTTSNNVATHILTNASGCDSLIALRLTIDKPDASVTINDPRITANSSIALYQWLDCKDNFAKLIGDTNQTFKASSNGSYAVELRKNGCVDTSECITIMNVGLESNSLFNRVSIYPNPSSGIVNIDLGSIKEVSVSVFDVNGQLVYYVDKVNDSIHQFRLNASSGVYTIQLNANGEKLQFKLYIK